MSISSFARAAAGSLVRSLWNRDGAAARRRRRRGFSPAIDTLESRRALAITGVLSIGGNEVGTYFDAPTGVANLGDFVTVSIEGTKGTVIFNGITDSKSTSVADGTDIQSIEIIDASPDFQLTFTASVTLADPVPYSSDGVVEMGRITTANVIRGINTVRGPLTLTAAPQEISTSAIHLYTFNDGTVSGTTVTDLVGGLDGTLFNGASVSNGQLVLADNSGATGANVQYMQMPPDVIPQGSTAATFELWFTASSGSGVWSRGFDFGSSDQNYAFFSPRAGGGGSRTAISQASSAGEKLVNGSTAYNDGVQHLVTVTIDDAADTMVYYIDGVEVGQVSLGSTNLSGLEAVNNFLGRSQFAPDPGFLGSMNQFAIYDRALSSAEVAANFSAGPISGSLAPIGFTQATPGSASMELEGDQMGVFPVGTFVCATPLLPATTPLGSPTFSTVQAISFDVNTNRTTITLAGPTAAGTTAGALTLAEAVRPEFRLTSFVGVNFSNLNLKEGGGLFVDVVEGADTEVDGLLFRNVGIVLSDGLLAYSSIGIRKELAATVLLGFNRSASVDGRMFVEFATPESLIFVGPQNTPTAKNSKFQLTAGPAPFGAGVFVAQPFDGVVNLGGAAIGSWVFDRGVGPNAVLNARSWVGQTFVEPFVDRRGIAVNGTFAGSINATSGDLANNGDIAMLVVGNLAATARVNAEVFAALTTVGSVLKGATVVGGAAVSLDIGGNLLGSVLAGAWAEDIPSLSGIVRGNVSNATLTSESEIELSILGNVLNSTFSADNFLRVSVGKNVSGSRFHNSEDGGVSMLVGGNFTKSFINACGDDDDLDDISLRLDVGGNLTSSTVQSEENMVVAVNNGNVSKSTLISTERDISLDVGGALRSSKLRAADGIRADVSRDAVGNEVLADGSVYVATDAGNVSGVIQSAGSTLEVIAARSVLKGSSFSSGADTRIDVGGNFDATTTSRRLRFFVDGNVSKASRIVTQQVTDWQGGPLAGPNFGIGGRFDGIVNVVEFDAAPDYQNVTLIGGGAGPGARFYVDRFFDDNLFFEGNFNGNLRVLQDLVASLNFGGNVDRITIGGTVGSYGLGAVGETNGNTEVKFTPVSINVAGRLRYLTSNSLFQAATPGVNGTFYSLATPTSGYQSLAATGILTTGRYVTVVPTRQTVPAPTPPGPQTYTAPTAPRNFSASPTTGPNGINVSFDAPTSNGGLPIVYYEYTTNQGTNWRRFNTPSQGPGTNIALTVDSLGTPFSAGTPGYFVNVRAVNAIGATPADQQVYIEIPTP